MTIAPAAVDGKPESAANLYKRLQLIGDIDTIVADCADLIAAHQLGLDTVCDVLAEDMFGAA